MNGMPSAYILRYSTAMGSTSGGVSINVRMGRATTSVTASRNTPETMATVIELCMALEARFSSFWPMAVETATFAPTETPTKRLTIRLITELLQPTAAVASASCRAKCPTTARSTELNSCWSRLLAAIGSAKAMILVTRGPCSMSILCEVGSGMCVLLMKRIRQEF